MASNGPEVSDSEFVETRNLVLEGITYQLEEDRRASEDKFKKTVKQLLLKWHPDKNADMVDLATAATQHIHSEVERLEQGLPRGFLPGQAPPPGDFHPYNFFAGSESFRKNFEEAYKRNREWDERMKSSSDRRSRYTPGFSSRPTTGSGSARGTYTPPNQSSRNSEYTGPYKSSTAEENFYKPFTKPRTNIPKSRSNPNIFTNGTSSSYKPSTHDYKPGSSRFDYKPKTTYGARTDGETSYSRYTNGNHAYTKNRFSDRTEKEPQDSYKETPDTTKSTDSKPEDPGSASGPDDIPTVNEPTSTPDSDQPAGSTAQDEIPSEYQTTSSSTDSGQPTGIPESQTASSDPDSGPTAGSSESQTGSSRPSDPEPQWSTIGLPDKPLLLIRQAHHDLRAADNDYNAEDPAFDWVCFKTQQASEKALKALHLIKTSIKSYNHELTSLSAMTGDEELKRLSSKLQSIIGETNKLYNLVQVDVEVIPHDEYTKDMACDAIMCANDILLRVTEIVGCL